MNNAWIALGLTVLAGMATAIGSTIAFMARKTDYRFLSVATGFSAGVMLCVSFVEIFFTGADALTRRYGGYWGHWINAASFFGGILLIGLIDNLIPAEENPHETHSEAETMPLRDRGAAVPDLRASAAAAWLPAQASHDRGVRHAGLMRVGLFTALAIGIHNFPEGLATFLAGLHDPRLGVAIAVAIALHNFPEGISVSVPIFYATGDRRKAFRYSVLSGLAEPAAAAIAFLALRLLAGRGGAVPPQFMGILFGGVAGIMVYISLDEMLPTSRAYGKGHDSLLGLVAGMLVMAVSLPMMH